MKGIIIEKGFNYYTHMDIILAPIEEYVILKNWLITNYECNQYPDERIAFNKDYVYLTGDELLEIVNSNDIQFIWGVFSAFNKDIPLSEILNSDFPYADGYTGFWKNPLTLQHPLAETEIAPWDSTLVLAISKNADIIQKLSTTFPLFQDLELYNSEM